MNSGEEDWWSDLEDNDQPVETGKVEDKKTPLLVINNIIERGGNYSNLAFQDEYERRFSAEGAVPLIDMNREHSNAIIWLSWLFGGVFGVHRFLLGHWPYGILYFFSFGMFFVGWVLDAFSMNELIDEARENQRMREKKRPF